MEKKTHVMCANFVSLCLIRPDNISDLLITCGFATLGGLVPDVDLKDSTSDKLFDGGVSVCFLKPKDVTI